MTLRLYQAAEIIRSSPRSSYNKSKVRVYNLNQPLAPLSPHPSDQSNFSFTLADIDNSLEDSSLISLSPRPSINSTSSSHFFQNQTTKNTSESGGINNPYFPCQKISDKKIDQIKKMLKMKFNRNKDNSNESVSMISVLDDQTVDSLISRLLKRVTEIRPSFNFNSLSTNNNVNYNLQSTMHFEENTKQYLSPRSPRYPVQSPRIRQNLRKNGKLMISHSTLEDVHKDVITDQDEKDEYDLKIIELKRRLNEIVRLINERNLKA